MTENKPMRARRIELDLTMKDVADAVGVSEATVSRWESGDIADMKRSRIISLAKVLKISPMVVLGWGQKPDEVEDPNLIHRDTMFDQAEAILKASGYSIDVVDDDSAVIKRGNYRTVTSVDEIVAAYEAINEQTAIPVCAQLIRALSNSSHPARPEVTDEDIKFALFGGDEEITDEMLDAVKKFAKFVKMKDYL